MNVVLGIVDRRTLVFLCVENMCGDQLDMLWVGKLPPLTLLYTGA